MCPLKKEAPSSVLCVYIMIDCSKVCKEYKWCSLFAWIKTCVLIIVSSPSISSPPPPWEHVLSYTVTPVLRDHCHEGVQRAASLPVAHPGYQVLSDILFRLCLIASECSHTEQCLDCKDLN